MFGRVASLAIALATIGAAAVGACSGHHEDLAASGGASVATAASSDSAMSVATSSSAATAGDSSASSGGAGGGDAGPLPPTSLTVVNGVVDYDAIRLCFTAYPSGADVDPWPKTASGLPFAGGAAIDTSSANLPANVDVLPYVIAGDLARTEDLSCAAILALAAPNAPSGGAGGGNGGGGGGGSGGASSNSAGLGGAGGGSGGSGGAGSAESLIVAPLAVVPAAVLASGKSVLLVATGCLGSGHTGTQAMQACGMNYVEGSSNASLVALAMSRSADASHIALQVVHASAAAPALDVSVTPGFDAATEIRVASSIALGTVAPVPPLSTVALADFGVLTKMVVKTYAANTTIALSTTPSSALFAQGNVVSSNFVDGHGVALVAVGGSPGVTADAWWHAFTYALVRSDP